MLDCIAAVSPHKDDSNGGSHVNVSPHLQILHHGLQRGGGTSPPPGAPMPTNYGLCGTGGLAVDIRFEWCAACQYL